MRTWLKVLALGLLAGGACNTEAPVKNVIQPVGVMRGSFLYSGLPPCTEGGKPVGNGIILVFNQNLLPPPDGLASRSAAIYVVPGEKLFAEQSKTLTYAADGSRLCPDPNLKPILASSDWALSPFLAGNYQIRAFYDYDGDFHAAFRFTNLPTRGDVTGGAIDNVTEALAGKAPQFTNIRIGMPDGNGGLTMPNNGEDGVLVDNITVAVALPSPYSRPYFHVASVQPGKVDDKVTPPPLETNPSLITMPTDWRIFDPASTAAQPHLWALSLEIGVPAPEVAAATAAPFNMKLKDQRGVSAAFPLIWWDVNRDGRVRIEEDHVIGVTIAPNLAPLVTMQKLDPTDPIRRTPQASPRVINSAVALNATTSIELLSFDSKTPVYQAKMGALIRPTGVCLPDATDRNGLTTVVTPFATGTNGAPVIPDEKVLLDDIAVLLNRKRENFKILYACIPPGDFSINTINTTGQAWTLPNESGVCMPGEKASEDGTRCGTRARLPSQSTSFRFGAAADPAGCVERFKALPAADQERYKTTCLRPDEQEKLANGTLWK